MHVDSACLYIYIYSVCLGPGGKHACMFYAILHASLLDGNVGVTLEDILVFATGSAAIPVSGFDHQPELHFDHSACIPTAATCGSTLVLPMKDKKMKFNTVHGHFKLLRIWTSLN